MANTFTKLVALGTAVASIGAITFEFTPYSSKDSLIKQGVDSLKAIVQGKDEALAKLQAEYDEVMANLNNANQSLETARAKLQAIYQKITGQAWDEANGDILNFDFNSLIKDGNQFENNVNGDAIAEILGLPAGSTTEQIIVAIQNLQEQIADLAQQVQNLQAQVAELQAEIATYKAEESALVLDLQQQIADLKARAESEANAIIDEANTEEQEQLDYINNTLTELGAEQVREQVPEEDATEPEEEKTLSYNYVGDWSTATHKEQFDQAMAQAVGDFKDEVNLKLYADNDYMIAVYTDNQEFFNQITSHQNWNDINNGECFYIDEDGNIVDKATGQENHYYKVRIMYRANL